VLAESTFETNMDMELFQLGCHADISDQMLMYTTHKRYERTHREWASSFLLAQCY